MSDYGELDPMVEHRTQFAFNGKTYCIAKVKIPNMAYPGQRIGIEIPHGSRDDAIVSDTINNSDIYGTYKDLYLSKKEREEKLL